MPPDATHEVSRIIAAAEEITLDPTTPASPTNVLGEDTEIARLAALTPLAYERERQSAARQLGYRLSVLDKYVAEARGGVDNTIAGHALNLPEPVPWPEPVNGAALLDGIVNATCRYMILDETLRFPRKLR
jgi:putative DNA primase/helicase